MKVFKQVRLAGINRISFIEKESLGLHFCIIVQLEILMKIMGEKVERSRMSFRMYVMSRDSFLFLF